LELELLEELELELLEEFELELLDEFELELPAEAGGVPMAASAARTAFSEGPAKGASVAAPAAMSPQTPTAV
jgi:hypothetical protein